MDDMMISSVKIGDKWVGSGNACLIIAEAGVNHNGDIKLAHKLIDVAVESGADAVKFQSFVTEDLLTKKAMKASYQVQTTGKGGSQFDMLKKLELSWDQQAELKSHCVENGILYLCTPYERESVDFLISLQIAAMKVASTDTTNIPFLRYLASKNCPVILSTGMSTLGEVEEAVNILKTCGLKDKIVLLHCTSEYPAPIEHINLRAMKTIEQAFGCPVGFSDHTQGVGASPWAVALGASMIEKHFTLDRNLEGPDHRASIEPHEMKRLIATIRHLEVALGDGIKRPMPSELENKRRMQKSLVAKRKISSGEIIQAEDLACKRPGNGLPPGWFDRAVGKKAIKDIEKDDIIILNDINWD
jgi:N-acetylneuraminate synthase